MRPALSSPPRKQSRCLPRGSGDNPCGRAEPLALPESSRTNADDCLPRASLGRIEGSDGIVERRDGPDVRPQPSVPHPLDVLTQLGAIRQDNKVDRQTVIRPRLGRPRYGHELSSGSDQPCRPRSYFTADDIENQIDAADVLEHLRSEEHTSELQSLMRNSY